MFSPVDGARMTSDFQGGFRSSGGHSGVDFAAPQGSAIRAVVGGTVMSVGWGGKYGNLITVQHDDGSVGYYAHLHRFGVRSGQRIDTGMFIGEVGSTGNSTGPHLHFEVRQNGSPVNPWPWLESAGQAQNAGANQYMLPMGTHEHTTVERDNSALLAALEEPQPQQPVLSTPGGGFLAAAGGAIGGEPLGEEQLDDNPMALETMLGEEAEFFQRQSVVNQFPMQPTAPMSSTWTPQALNRPVGNPAGTGNPFDRLRNAIAQQESGGNFRAVNPSSGALGKYQVMPANVASWSKAALGYSITPQQFLNDQAIQERIVQHRLGEYYRKYGAAGAALAWYAGEGALRYSDAARNRPQGAYPSMNSYVQSILRKAGL